MKVKLLGDSPAKYVGTGWRFTILLLSEQVRKSGYGKRLLLVAEKLAKEKECDIIKLDTFPLYGERRYTSNSYQQRTTLHMRRLPNPWYWGLSGTPGQTPSACPSMPCTSSPLDKINKPLNNQRPKTQLIY
ncbi:GNAT family N-acetyltransferase [Paenibacillus thiaminolyticus]|uniref:hypothetical protein n=1 Tax=Paenibacillus thiaminolyticus TaxID=49283 RepID=UPI002350B9DE|nr:hypothetical protein [Paenibacillus thiaminolyticus]WCR26885.1 GNAT family N-acetyltransferase [Paenibacillus thiaminolyticus]